MFDGKGDEITEGGCHAIGTLIHYISFRCPVVVTLGRQLSRSDIDASGKCTREDRDSASESEETGDYWESSSGDSSGPECDTVSHRKHSKGRRKGKKLKDGVEVARSRRSANGKYKRPGVRFVLYIALHINVTLHTV